MSAQDVRDTSPDELLMHEEEPQGPTQSGKAMVIKLLIALGIGILIMMLPRPENLPVEGHRLAAILLPVVFLWVSEAIPIGITALLGHGRHDRLQGHQDRRCLGALRQPGGHVRHDDHHVRRGPERSGSGQAPPVPDPQGRRHQRQEAELLYRRQQHHPVFDLS
jgi:hypothetical protein